jgi:hypothetical protein
VAVMDFSNQFTLTNMTGQMDPCLQSISIDSAGQPGPARFFTCGVLRAMLPSRSRVRSHISKFNHLNVNNYGFVYDHASSFLYGHTYICIYDFYFDKYCRFPTSQTHQLSRPDCWSFRGTVFDMLLEHLSLHSQFNPSEMSDHTAGCDKVEKEGQEVSTALIRVAKSRTL